jgi:hypothetical protein
MTDNAPPADQAPTGTPPPTPPAGGPPTPPAGGKKKCADLPPPPKVPELPKPKDCPQPCDCPTPPGGPPQTCFDDLIKAQSKLVTQADRAKAFVDELTAIQAKVVSAQADYTQARYKDLLKQWHDQDKLIVDLLQKLACGVPCWECLLECRLCLLLTDIHRLEQQLNGTGELTTAVFSLLDLQFWHQRNVAQMQARVDRINLVLGAWEKPSDTLGDVLDKNSKLIDDTQKNLAADPGQAVFDVFMTLLPRHWAIRPRSVTSGINTRFINICPCDEGTPDDCCGPDVGVLTLRERLIGPLPYIVDPADFPEVICCITSQRLAPASDQLANAQADLAAVTAQIEQTRSQITDKTNAIEASFEAELGNPIDCSQYKKKGPCPPPPNGCGSEPTQTGPKPADQKTAG